MRYTPIDEAAFTRQRALSEPLLEPWEYADQALRADFATRSFTEAGRLAAEISLAADAADHHPDIDVRYPGVVRVVITTHATGGVTEHDVRLAATITQLAASLATTSEPAPGA